jgi:predicted nucleotidyltransferase component of viral defense system
MIKELLQEYTPKNKTEAESALREIMQEVALAGLQRAGFFEKAAFYGGSALRIFYGLSRYSEDLDFSLLEINPTFSLEPYFDGIIGEFEAVGMKVTIKEKKLILDGIIPQAGVQASPGIKIKLEVDREPPLGFETEEKLLLRPFSFYVKCFTLSSLFAGKVHALLFRKWGTRVKGRDWYDLEWYIKNGVPLDLHHFLLRAQDTGDWKEDTITQDQLIQLLSAKIDSVSFDGIREDIIRFIPDESVLDIWSRQYFKDLVGKLKFK